MEERELNKEDEDQDYIIETLLFSRLSFISFGFLFFSSFLFGLSIFTSLLTYMHIVMWYIVSGHV